MRTPTKVLIFLLAGSLAPIAARAQLVQEFHPPHQECCLQRLAQRLADDLQDWPQISRFQEADQRLMAKPAEKDRVVFMGDSITEKWDLAKYFPGRPYVNRGIGGQTTPQMVLRMYPDVIDLHPAAVVILAGTNDIPGNTGPETLKMVEENLRAMCDLAKAHQIKVVLCTITPVSDYTPYKQLYRRPPEDILELNKWIRSYVVEIHAQLADYFPALVDGHGLMRKGLSEDGVHPNARGYMLMVPVVEAAIEQALGK